MKKSVLLLFFAGCVATGIFGIGRKIPMNRVNDLGQREGYWRDSLGEGITHELYYKGGKKDGLFKCFIRNELFLFGEYTADNMSGTWYMFGDEGELRCTIDSIEFNKDSIYTGYPCCRIFCKGEFYQFNLSSCIRQQNSLTAQFVSFSLSNLANIFYPPPIFTIINLCLL